MERTGFSSPALEHAGLLALALIAALCAVAFAPLIAQLSPHSLVLITSLIFAIIGASSAMPRCIRATSQISAALTGGSATLAVQLDTWEGLALSIFALVYGTAMTGLVRLRLRAARSATAAAIEIKWRLDAIDHVLAGNPNSHAGWMLETDTAGNIQYATAGLSDFSGRSASEIRGLPLDCLLAEGSAGGGWDRLLLAAKAREAAICTFEIMAAGERCWWQVVLQPMADAGGGFSGHRGVARDVTTERQIRRRLLDARQQAQRESRRTLQFLESVILEVRPPINTMLGFAEFLQSPAARDLAEDERRTHHQLMLDCGRQLSAFIADVGDMARIDANHFHLVEQEVDAAELTEIAMKFCGAVAEEADAVVIVNVIENVELRCDAARVRRALVTLVTRAARAGRSGGAVHVSFARRNDGGLDIVVTDQGPVLTGDDIAQAFEPSLHEPGMEGLSLPIARRIARLHGGNLTVKPALGGGMSACFSLPSSRVSWKSGNGLETTQDA